MKDTDTKSELIWLEEVLTEIVSNTLLFFTLLFLCWILIPYLTSTNVGMKETVRMFCKCENVGNNYQEFKSKCKEHSTSEAKDFINRMDTYKKIFDDESENFVSKIIISIDGIFSLRKYQLEVKSYCPSKYDATFGEAENRIPYFWILLILLVGILVYTILNHFLIVKPLTRWRNKILKK